MEKKTLDDVCAILARNGFSNEIVERFRGSHYIYYI